MARVGRSQRGEPDLNPRVEKCQGLSQLVGEQLFSQKASDLGRRPLSQSTFAALWPV